MADPSREVLDEYSKYVNVDNLHPDGKVRIGSDLSRFDNREQVKQAVAEAQENENNVKKTVQAPRSRLSFGTIFLFLLFVIIASLLIKCYDKQNELSVELANKKSQYADELARNSNLKTKNDQRYVLSDIEDYAVNTLGMVKFENSQIEYIEIETPETITRMENSNANRNFDLITFLREKFEEILNFLT